MTEQHTETPDALTKVARDLSAIEDLATHLADQAVHKANDRLMPGGRALVANAPDANLDEWAELVAAAEFKHFATCPKTNHRGCVAAGAEHVEDEDDQHAEDPLRTLLFWTDEWRREWDQPCARPTLVSEADFIRKVLTWAWDYEFKFDDFARDVNAARRRLEDLLYDGRRKQRSRVLCPDCEKPTRLIKVYSWDRNDTEGEGDHWKCPTCKTRLDSDAYQRAYALQLLSQGARRFVSLSDALAILKAQGRPERTVRQWIADGDVDTDRTNTGMVRVWWPDVWTLHNARQTRRREGAA